MSNVVGNFAKFYSKHYIFRPPIPGVDNDAVKIIEGMLVGVCVSELEHVRRKDDDKEHVEYVGVDVMGCAAKAANVRVSSKRAFRIWKPAYGFHVDLMLSRFNSISLLSRVIDRS